MKAFARLAASVLLLGAAQDAVADETPRSARVSAESPIQILAGANADARQGPQRESFAAARQIYAFQEGALYQLYANPNFVSVILLAPGERISAIAAGDTARWTVTEAQSQDAGEPRTIVLVKPQAEGLRTNIVLVTDKRTYLIEALSQAGPYAAEIAWSYPQSPQPSDRTAAIENLNFAYRIRTVRGRSPHWAPAYAFDDGRRTLIVFPESVAASDLPPLFVIGAEGAELVNYRVENRSMIVDRLFDRAELRLGTRSQTIVRIERDTRRADRPAPQGGESP